MIITLSIETLTENRPTLKKFWNWFETFDNLTTNTTSGVKFRSL